jgi:hypothetical protein
MIVQEPFTKDGKQKIRRYSDRNVYIHGGNPEADYDVAVDFADAVVTYVETDRPINAEEISDSEALAIITGTEYNGAEGGEEV